MAKVRARGSGPERIIDEVLRSARYSFVQHDTGLPGTPDFVLPRHRLAIFVHGCFWHAHSCRRGRSMPTTRRSFWEAKKAQNVSRDSRATNALRRMGFGVLVIWECQLKDKERLLGRVRAAIRRRAT